MCVGAWLIYLTLINGLIKTKPIFHNKKYLDYFQQLYSIERDMEKEAVELLAMIRDPKVRKLLNKMRTDEQRHARIVEELIALVS